MLNKKNTITQFEEKVRVRVCGILEEDNQILLLKHDKIGPAGYLWSPPGGGVEFGESHEEALKKEFKEETNLVVEIVKFLFTNEFISEKHHAIELFFLVKRISGDLMLGNDPELGPEQQILSDARFFSYDELKTLPKNAIHNAFNTVYERDKITELRGLITFKH
ncbi:NUDIX domain-containing protein [Ekhidna sp.]|uniref:NUDIX domain-containing protein n=1 Tax=Ekhidna sp. TaxID=2608089 RepID=UPI003B510244